MSSLRSDAVQRWLRLAVAGLALVLGTGMHEWLHSSDAALDPDCVTEAFELHAGDCEHHGPEVAGHETDCLVCKTTSRQVALPLDGRAVGHDDITGRLAVLSLCDGLRASAIPGVLGARAPPVTV